MSSNPLSSYAAKQRDLAKRKAEAAKIRAEKSQGSSSYTLARQAAKTAFWSTDEPTRVADEAYRASEQAMREGLGVAGSTSILTELTAKPIIAPVPVATPVPVAARVQVSLTATTPTEKQNPTFSSTPITTPAQAATQSPAPISAASIPPATPSAATSQFSVVTPPVTSLCVPTTPQITSTQSPGFSFPATDSVSLLISSPLTPTPFTPNTSENWTPTSFAETSALLISLTSSAEFCPAETFPTHAGVQESLPSWTPTPRPTFQFSNSLASRENKLDFKDEFEPQEEEEKYNFDALLNAILDARGEEDSCKLIFPQVESYTTANAGVAEILPFWKPAQPFFPFNNFLAIRDNKTDLEKESKEKEFDAGALLSAPGVESACGRVLLEAKFSLAQAEVPESLPTSTPSTQPTFQVSNPLAYRDDTIFFEVCPGYKEEEEYDYVATLKAREEANIGDGICPEDECNSLRAYELSTEFVKYLSFGPKVDFKLTMMKKYSRLAWDRELNERKKGGMPWLWTWEFWAGDGLFKFMAMDLDDCGTTVMEKMFTPKLRKWVA